ncbi:MAG: carbohydrate ABC transporter permease [Ruthenibacterium sp.]
MKNEITIQRQKSRRIKITKNVLSNVMLSLFGLVMAYPLLWMLFSSFKANNEVFNTTKLLPTIWHFENYIEGWFAFPRQSFTTFFANSFLISILIVIGSVISCTLAAYPFARLKFPFKNLLFAVLMGTMMLPSQVLLIPRYLMFTKMGWTNSYKPLTIPAFLAQVSGAFFIYLMVQFMRGIPNELSESAVVDGCGHFRIFFNIILPNCKQPLFSFSIFSFIWSWDDFLNQLIYIDSPPKFTVSLALRMFNDDSAMINWGSLFGISILSILPCLIIFACAQKYFVEGISTTGLK